MRLWAKTIGAAAVTMLAVPTMAQDATRSDQLRASVVVAVAEALGAGADTATPPDYAAELKTARDAIDSAYFCQPTHPVGSLPDGLNERVVANALSRLDAKAFAITLSERPAFVTDLLVTAVASFELGRLISIKDEEGKKLCAEPVPG